jgi:C-terminal processing protease CtpA/Prc
MDPGSLRDLQVQTRGEFGGLGIEVTMDDGLVARRLADIRRGTLKKTAATLRNQPDAAQAEERLLSVLRC